MVSGTLVVFTKYEVVIRQRQLFVGWTDCVESTTREMIGQERETGVKTGSGGARPSALTGLPLGSGLMSSSSSSRTAFSANGFAFLFLTRPTSIVTFRWLRESLLAMDWKPEEGCTRIIALGSSSGWRPIISCVRASLSVSCLSSCTKQEAVKDVVHSRSTRINWR